MAKLTKEELISKIKDSAIEDEIKIELLEDVTDSFESEDKSSEMEELQKKYDDLKEKYISRFTEATESKKEEVKEDESEDSIDEEMKEEEVIDVKEI